jgi:hypothetical protein
MSEGFTMAPGQSVRAVIRGAALRIEYQPEGHPEKPYLAFRNGTCVSHHETLISAKVKLGPSSLRWGWPK